MPAVPNSESATTSSSFKGGGWGQPPHRGGGGRGGGGGGGGGAGGSTFLELLDRSNHSSIPEMMEEGSTVNDDDSGAGGRGDDKVLLSSGGGPSSPPSTGGAGAGAGGASFMSPTSSSRKGGGGSMWSRLKSSDGHVRRDLLAQRSPSEASRGGGASNYGGSIGKGGGGGAPRLMRAVMSYRKAMNKDPTKEKRVRFKEVTATDKLLHDMLSPWDPRHPFITRFRSLNLIFLSITFFRLPVFIAFATNSISWDVVADVYFLLSHLLSLNTGYYHRDTMVMDRPKIVAKWLSWEQYQKGERDNLYVFLVEFIPFYSMAIIANWITYDVEWLLDTAALCRVRRLYDLLHHFHLLELNLETDIRVLAVVKYALVMLGSAHWFGCIWWSVARFSGFQELCWIRQYIEATGLAMDPRTVRGHYRAYFISLMWGFSTLAGIGYMGYSALLMQEIITYICMTFVQVLVFSFLFGVLLHYIVKRDAEQERFKALMGRVEEYGNAFDLPRKLLEHMRRFYKFQYMKKIGEDEEILNGVPMALRTKIMANRYTMVAANEIFDGCDKHFVSTILALLRPKVLIPGTAIYYANDVAREVCFLESGQIEMLDGEDETVMARTIRPEDTSYPPIGELAFFLGIPQPFTFCASNTSDVRLLTLSKDEYDEIKDRYPEARDRLISNIRRTVGIIKVDGEEPEGSAEATAAAAARGGGQQGGGSVTTTTMTTTDRRGGGSNSNNNSSSHNSNRLMALFMTPHQQQERGKSQELRRKIGEALRRKQEEDVATIFNAVREGDVEEVKNMISHGYDPNAVDYDGRSALHFAAVQGDDRIVESLLQRAADVHLRDRWGRNAIQDAVDNNHVLVTKLLAGQGAEFKLKNVANRLCSAALSDDLYELQRLVENGIDVNACDYDKRTALHLGACGGNSKIVEFILLPMTKGNASVKDRWGISPLFDAIKHENPAVARILYENGAALSLERAATFLCSAAADGDFPMLRLLHECGVSCNIGDYDNRYLIHLAAAEGEVVSVDFLIFAGADLSVQDRWGRTPLDDAIAGGHWSSAKLLLCYGAARTDAITEEVEHALRDTSVDEIRAFVQHEKFQQERRKDTEKRLRDHVKWISADASTWLRNLTERLVLLSRVMEKLMRNEDADTLTKEAGTFMEQVDEDILTPQKPTKSAAAASLMQDRAATMSSPQQQAYMLSRYMLEATGNTASLAIATTKSLRSMQHFFLQVGIIEKAFRKLRSRLPPEVTRNHDAPCIDETTILRVLDSYGITITTDDAVAIMRAGRRALRAPSTPTGASTPLSPTFAAGGGSGSLRGGGTSSSSTATSPTLPIGATYGAGGGGGGSRIPPISWTQLLVSFPFWTAVMSKRPPSSHHHHHGGGGDDLSVLQEAVSTVMEGFRLLDTDGNHKLSRAEWRLDKKEHDVGDFAAAIDRVFIGQDNLTMELFFKVVADWVGATDDEVDEDDGDDDDEDDDEDGTGGGQEEDDLSTVRGFGILSSPVARGEHNTPWRGPAAMALVGSAASGRVGAEESDPEDWKFGLDSPAARSSSRRTRGSGSKKSQQAASTTLLLPPPVVGGDTDSTSAPLTKRSFSHHHLVEDIVDDHPPSLSSLFSRTLNAFRLRLVRRHILQTVVPDSVARPEDIAERFSRIDKFDSGYLTRRLTEGLLRWTFGVPLVDVDFSVLLDYIDPLHKDRITLATVQDLVDWIISPHHHGWWASAIVNVPMLTRRRQGLASQQGVEQEPATVFDNGGAFMKWWSHVTVAASFYYFASVPYQIAFLRHGLTTTYASCLYASYFFDCILILDVFFKFNTAFTDERSVKVWDRARIRRHYFMTSFPLDLLAALPVDVLARLGGSTSSSIAWLRLPKLRHSKKAYVALLASSSNRLIAEAQQLYVSAAAAIHILSCIWFMMTEGVTDNYQRISKYARFGDYSNGSDDGGPLRLHYYIFIMMYITLLMAGKSFSGLVVGRLNEQLFIIFMLILNLSVWSYIMGIVSGLFISADETIAASHDLMESVTRFTKNNNVSPESAEELKAFFTLKAQGNLSLQDEREIYRNLPLSMQIQVARHVSRDTVKSVDLFRGTSEPFLDSVCTLLLTEMLSPGEFLYKADDVCRALYIVDSGAIEVVRWDPAITEYAVHGVVEAGGALGQLEFCFDIRYLHGARAQGVVRLFRLPREEYNRLIKLYPSDEDIIFHNLSSLSEDEKIVHDQSSVGGGGQGSSSISVETELRSTLGADCLQLFDRALDGIAKAKRKSEEQRVRSLCNAAAIGDMDQITRLLNSGVSIDATDANKRSALMLATCNGNLDLVKWLMDRGADPNLKDGFGGCALADALAGGHLEIMAYLKKHGAVLELEDAAGDMCRAAADGNVELLRQFLTLGVDPNVADHDKRTALHLAASEGHLDCVKLLLSRWANVNPIDRMGGTPLEDSVRHGHTEVSDYLREHGAVLNIKPIELGTHLCEAAAQGDIERLRIFTRFGADMNTGDYDGRTALHLASCCNRLGVIEYLVSLPGIDVNPLDRFCHTPYDDAIREGQEAIASVLQVKGGLAGTDPRMGEAVERHLQKPRDVAMSKAMRRDNMMMLFRQQTTLLERLTQIYRVMSDHLPTYCKAISTLSMTIRSRKSSSVIDRTARPDLHNTRLYFYHSFKAYLERTYMQNLDGLVTLVEEFEDCRGDEEERLVLFSRIMTTYFMPESPDYIQMDPAVVQALQAEYVRSQHHGNNNNSRHHHGHGPLPRDMFDRTKAFVLEELAALLPKYYTSDEYYTACRRPDGFLWRVTKLCRVVYTLSTLLLEQVVVPLLSICDEDELSCVPHYYAPARAAFRQIVSSFQQHMMETKARLHIMCFLVKEQCVKDKLREMHSRETLGRAGGGPEAAAKMIMVKKNYLS